MDKLDEKMIAESIRSGDPEPHLNQVLGKAKAFGSLPWEKETKGRLWRVLAPALSAVLALAVAVPITWSITQKMTRDADLSSQQGGNAQTTNVEKYLSETAKYHYQSSIGTLIDSGTIYADLYYAFDSAERNFIVIADRGSKIKQVSAYNGTYYLGTSSSTISDFMSTTFVFDWDFVFTPVLGSDVTIAHSFDLKPFYDSIVSQQ